MRDILIKRNELKNKSICMRSMRFEPNVKAKKSYEIGEKQNEIYQKWKFYDKFVKAREEAKHEIKFNNVGKRK